MPEAINIFIRMLILIILSSVNFEYLLNRQSSMLATILCLIIELALIKILFSKQIKTLFK
jgi:hypothetical protein